VILKFSVYGVAQPKGSARAFMPNGAGMPVVTSDNPKNKGWQQLVAEAGGRAIEGIGGTMFSAGTALTLWVEFRLPRPASLPKRVVEHTKKPDLDKLIRSVKDALTKVAWNDDSQVVEVYARKIYAAKDEAPRADILIRERGGER
jgi:hypothetical protein